MNINNQKTLRKANIKRIAVIVVILCVCLTAFLLGYPSIYDRQCRTRIYDDLQKKITADILKANIVIVQKKTEKQSEMVTSGSYSVGSSGVIFKKEGNSYYALTAYHVFDDAADAEWIVIPWGAKSYSDYAKNKEGHVSLEEYYNQFSRGELIAADKNYDLAILRFQSEDSLNALKLSNNNPGKGSRIAVISNPEGKRFVQTYGVIKSMDYYLFETKDGLPASRTLKHNAYEAPGSSGSVALNEDMEIVGINIGGATDAFGRFKFGVMVPCELVNIFIGEQLT